MRSTRIVVKALTPKGVESLKIQMSDEVALRKEWAGVPRWKIPLNIRDYLKTVSVFVPESAPEEHQILGFSRMNSYHKHLFYVGVKKAFEVNGCSLNDFEVKFFDE